jgi:hypothetical protein
LKRARDPPRERLGKACQRPKARHLATRVAQKTTLDREIIDEKRCSRHAR